MIIIDKNKTHGVIFDLDGTMIDNSPFHIKAWESFSKKYGFPFSTEIYQAKFSGGTNEAILPTLFGHNLSGDLLQKYAQEKEALYRKLYAPHIKETRGLKKLIKQIKLHKLAVAVATSSPIENIEFALKELGLYENVFDTIVGPNQVTHGKPHPEVYLKSRFPGSDSLQWLIWRERRGFYPAPQVH